ncbi:MAG: OmpA family protein [Bacteroidia bacterium]
MYVSLASYSQTFEYPWAINAGTGMVKYQSPPGTLKLPGGTFSPALNLGVSRYLAGGFDFRTQVLLSHQVNYPTSETVIHSQLIDMSYQLVFKINNGAFMRESSRVGPYLTFGVGGSYMVNHPDVYIPLGGGFRFKFNERMSARIETTKKISVNKDVQHLAHALAFVYNLDTKDIPTEKIEEEEMSEEMIVSALLPKDSDLDGVIDFDDQCPDDAGLVENHGCPQDVSTETETVIASSEESPEESDEIEEVATSYAAIEETEDADLPIEEEDISIDEEDEDIGMFVNGFEEDTDFDSMNELDEEWEEEEEIASVTPEYPEEESGTFSQRHHLNVLFGEPAHSATPPVVATAAKLPEPTTAPTVAAVPAPKQPASVASPCGSFNLDDTHVSPILFDVGSDALTSDAKIVLDQLAAMLESCPATQLILNGHADAVGTENSNLVLSIMRAYNVKYYLVYEHGISQQRIRSKGLGEQQPLAANDDVVGRKQNRRVDFQLIF